jgi:hypothetical protein
MVCTHDTFHLFTLVSEIVRRQRSRYEVPVITTSQKTLSGNAYFATQEPVLLFRWCVVMTEDGKSSLRMFCSPAASIEYGLENSMYSEI